jgi:hypothetical protein
MKYIKIICILTLLIIFSPQTSLACQCYTPPPPCYAYSQSDAVFIGTVKEIKNNNEFPPIKTRISVDKIYKGINSEEVFTETGSTSCDFEGYKENKKLLIYGSLYEKDKTFFSTSYCSRSTTFSENLIDLEFLKSLNNSTPNYWIWGTVSSGYLGSSIEGVKAEVFDDKKKLTGISDKDGDLKIVVSKEGKYKVRVYIPKGAEFNISQWEEQSNLLKRGGKNKKGRYLEYEVEVKNNQCGWFDTNLYGFKD